MDGENFCSPSSDLLWNIIGCHLWILTDVGVFEQATDPRFPVQLLVICGEGGIGEHRRGEEERGEERRA